MSGERSMAQGGGRWLEPEAVDGEMRGRWRGSSVVAEERAARVAGRGLAAWMIRLQSRSAADAAAADQGGAGTEVAADGVAASQRAYGRVAAREKSGRGLQVARENEGKSSVSLRMSVRGVLGDASLYGPTSRRCT